MGLVAYDLEFYERPISVPLKPTGTSPRTNGHLAQAQVRLEFFSTSAFAHVLIPELALAAFFGMGVLHQPAVGDWAELTLPLARAGLSVSVTRLWPSGWWFPIFLEVGQQFSPGRRIDPGWFAAAGVGF